MFIRFRRLLKSFTYAYKGLAKVIREEQNFRLELIAGAVVLLVAYLLKVKATDVAILLLAIGLVLCLEIVNTVAELISDAIKPKLGVYAKNIKDVVAAGVLLAAVTALAIGAVIFGKYLF